LITANVLWYGVVREFEAISYQFTPTFFTSQKRSNTSETRMHYTMCCKLAFCPPSLSSRCISVLLLSFFYFLFSVCLACVLAVLKILEGRDFKK
jgi:hypothetical protein